MSHLTLSRIRSRPLVMALVVVLIGAGLAFPARVAQAAAIPPDVSLVQERYEVTADHSGGFKVCVGETEKIFAAIAELTEYTTTAGRTYIARFSYLLGEVLRATVADTNIGQVAPLTGPSRAPTGGLYFKFTGKRAGRTSIEFTDALSHRATPITVPVEVKDCYYKVTIISNWHLVDGGFNPDMTSTISQAEMHLDPGHADPTFLGSTTVKNEAVGTPKDNCVPDITVGDDNIELHGTLDANRRWMEIIIIFHTVTATTTAECPGVEKSKDDQGEAKPLIFKVRAEGGRKNVPHILQAGRAVRGVAHVNIERVMP